MIKLIDVWKIYEMGDVKVEALRGLNLEVRQGEFLAIQGPSGSGKSTAMNMIGCLDVPSRGAIYLEGHDISKLEESDLAQIRGQKIGFVFQKFNLINTLSAAENVMLPMMFQEHPPELRRQRAYELLKLVDLHDRMDHKPNELSGGQQQRVAIARALANNPDVVLADEPTGNLDSKTGENVLSFLTKLHENEGKTIVMVTHDASMAKHADRVEMLLDGKIIKTLNNNHKRK
ncbi:ABC transporter ATP-binding protein [Candidatus Woesearchaeota archaeon]|nr:ABC transporter ATP-binding protein [Candidatus Woesearchaeota archaeon]